MREDQFSAAIGDWSLPAPHPRFGIYRNNVASALINALRVRFPVTGELAGRDLFNAMAGAYAERHRPASPVLIGYGESFPGFIGASAAAAAVPCLGDVAALESLWWQAYHAAEAMPLEAAELAAVPADRWGTMRFAFHPSLGLMASPHAVGAIWQAHRGGPRLAGIDAAGPAWLLVARPQAEVAVRAISPASHQFVAALREGARLADAVEAVTASHPDFDLPRQLHGLIGLNIITGLRP